MVRGRAAAVIGVLAFTLAGCSSIGGDDPPPTPETKDSKSGSTDGPLQIDGGTAAPEALTDFECAPVDDGDWSAVGSLENTGSTPADYRVTVVVGPADAPSGTGRELTVAGVPADGSTTFRTHRLPTLSGDTEPLCSVQVVRLP